MRRMRAEMPIRGRRQARNIADGRWIFWGARARMAEPRDWRRRNRRIGDRSSVTIFLSARTMIAAASCVRGLGDLAELWPFGQGPLLSRDDALSLLTGPPSPCAMRECLIAVIRRSVQTLISKSLSLSQRETGCDLCQGRAEPASCTRWAESLNNSAGLMPVQRVPFCGPAGLSMGPYELTRTHGMSSTVYCNDRANVVHEIEAIARKRSKTRDSEHHTFAFARRTTASPSCSLWTTDHF